MFKQLLLWTLGSFLLLQAIQIEIPTPPESIDPTQEIKAPPAILSLLKRSCYDCHSYQTKMPWYGEIAPVSFEVKSHIKNGRSALNFQTWADYTPQRQQKIYQGIVDTINFRMPMPLYLTLHDEAKLSSKERHAIKAWAKGLLTPIER